MAIVGVANATTMFEFSAFFFARSRFFLVLTYLSGRSAPVSFFRCASLPYLTFRTVDEKSLRLSNSFFFSMVAFVLPDRISGLFFLFFFGSFRELGLLLVGAETPLRRGAPVYMLPVISFSQRC